MDRLLEAAFRAVLQPVGPASLRREGHDWVGGSRRMAVALARLSPGHETCRMTGLTSAPAGYRFSREVITLAVRWYLRYDLSYRDVEELPDERGITVDHVTVYRWVQTLTPEVIEAARPARHASGDRWFLDETYVKVAGCWTYLYRAVEQHGKVIGIS